MPTLYNVTLAKPAAGFVLASVKSVRHPGLAGHWCAETRELIVPDRDAIRRALPHYYRAAFDRAGHGWFPDDNGPAYWTLYGSRGRYLNTIYARPYLFAPVALTFDRATGVIVSA